MMQKISRTQSSNTLKAEARQWLLIVFFCVLLVVVTESTRINVSRIRRDLLATEQESSESLGKEPESVLSYIRPKYLPAVAEFFYPNESSLDTKKKSNSQLIHNAVITRLYTSMMLDVLQQRYEYDEDLEVSGGPQVSGELCLNQLRQLIDRARTLNREKSTSRDDEISRLLDTFGRPSSSVIGGDVSWSGSYSECSGLKMNFNEGQSAMRYCSSSIRLNDWPEDKRIDDYAVLKMGVCLPKSCDSLDYKNKFQLIHQLIELTSRQVDIGEWKISYLYCLPDEGSSLLAWWRSPGTIIAGCLVVSWLSLLIFATIENKRYTKKNERVDETITKKAGDIGFDLTNGFKIVDPNDLEEKRKQKFYKSLSIIQNFKSLIAISDKEPKFASEKVNDSGEFACCSITDRNEARPIVDLRALEGVKVFCMIYVIIGHNLVYDFMIMKNWREFSSTSWWVPIITSAPAFAVNMFFTITGLLTTYLLFKNKPGTQTHPPMATPKSWFTFILYRYLRLLPIFAFTVMHAKYFSKYLGSGPFWDYGTAYWSPKRFCIEESWLWTVFIAVNFNQTGYSCVPPAWYLANDFQFALITPLLLFCLGKNKTLGKAFIIMCSVASFITTMVAQYLSPAPDMRAMVRAALLSFKTTLSYNAYIYFGPHYRISPYLIGILLGFALHQYEKKKLKWLEERTKHRQQPRGESKVANVKKARIEPRNENKAEKGSLEPNWSSSFRRFAPGICLSISGCFAFILPFFAPYLTLSKQLARISVSVLVPTLYSLHSLFIGLYLLLATTGYGYKPFNRFLELGIWKPLAKLGMCAFLINMELAGFFAGRTTQIRHSDFQFRTSWNIFIVLATYLAAAVLFLLVESPMKGIISHLLELAFSRKRNPCDLSHEATDRNCNTQV